MERSAGVIGGDGASSFGLNSNIGRSAAAVNFVHNLCFYLNEFAIREYANLSRVWARNGSTLTSNVLPCFRDCSWNINFI